MEDLTWLIVLSPARRKSVGFVDYYLDFKALPRLPHDDAYMGGWNEAKEMGAKSKSIQDSKPILTGM
ncbi:MULTISPECIES: hypothetical protein [unclassified Leptolyngbya]|uniref:hypothetical protein n=1 Tax=unclassified Leptolyngbya TaxID=2650499 RepID=UPI001682FBE7|nr:MULTISPECIES: hypothetical protein [unclassified Leptolyngbya]MBD1909241.1 hypothetical protein [Leptolyngbya sp. FACHB-8]MBD2156597.1 hypothetical protein [Leptolyngbya sp. FACHB-16]